MRIQREIFRIIKWIAILILALLAVFFLVRAIGKAIYNQTPAGGINESMYIVGKVIAKSRTMWL